MAGYHLDAGHQHLAGLQLGPHHLGVVGSLDGQRHLGLLANQHFYRIDGGLHALCQDWRNEE